MSEKKTFRAWVTTGRKGSSRAHEATVATPGLALGLLCCPENPLAWRFAGVAAVKACIAIEPPESVSPKPTPLHAE